VSIVFSEGRAADAEGNVYFTEITGNRISAEALRSVD